MNKQLGSSDVDTILHTVSFPCKSYCKILKNKLILKHVSVFNYKFLHYKNQKIFNLWANYLNLFVVLLS